MKVAHVAPADLEFLFETGLSRAKSRYHLVLAHVAKQSKEYAEFYAQLVEEGHYVIVDNGAYEFGVTGDFYETIDCVEHMRAHELVLPDDMTSGARTLELIREGLYALYKEYGKAYRPPHVKGMMFVPHGGSLDAWRICLGTILSTIEATFEPITMPDICIGIAEKDALALTNGDRGRLVQEVYDTVDGHRTVHPYRSLFHDYTPKIHLLGMMENLQEFHRADIYDRVRGVDGSKLIVYGRDGLAVGPYVVKELNDPTCVSSYPGRPDDYFFSVNWKTLPLHVQSIVRSNIEMWQHVPKQHIPKYHDPIPIG